MFKKIGVVFVVCFWFGGVYGCPNKNVIKPCFCTESQIPNQLPTIHCGGAEQIDLVQIFETLSRNLTYGKRFQSLHLNNTLITELKDNTFDDIGFDEILIEKCFNLTKINRNAFAGTDAVTKRLEFYKNPALSSPDNSIFDVLSRFTSLETLVLDRNNISEIPSNAFKPPGGNQDKLTTIELNGPEIKRLGSNAFAHFTNLSNIYINRTSIEVVPNNTFYFPLMAAIPSKIQISFSNNLNLKDFAVNSFGEVGFYYKVSYQLKFDHNQLNYLNISTFGDFLRPKTNEVKNTIDLNYNRLDCDNCANHWLINEPVKYLIGLKCSNDNHFDDLDNFKNCK